MNLRLVAKVLGLIVALTGAGMLTALPWAFVDAAPDRVPLLVSAAFALAVGLGVHRLMREESGELRRREAMAIVTLSWVAAAAFGALPFALTPGAFASWTDAFFESMSGFTTTGSSVLADVEALPRGLLWWRSLTQWLGGMGIIVLVIAVLPVFGIGGRQMFRSEVPGPTPEGLRPRVAQTARLLWAIYAGLTAIETFLLMIAGLGFFDAANHAFTTMATGGFGTRNHSVAAFGNPFAEWIIIAFMLLAGVNFSLHWRAINGDLRRVLKDVELRVYLIIAGVAATLVAIVLAVSGQTRGVQETARTALFQSVGLMTTTGYSSADFDLWPASARVLLVILMFVGGCAGSTGGGMKVIRVLLVARSALLDIRRTFRPHDVLTLKLGGRAVSSEILGAVVSFVSLFIGIWAMGSLALAFMGLDPVTAATASIAALGNIGPGLAGVGPESNFGGLPQAAKLLLSFLMLLGRLELFTVLALFSRRFWSR